MKKNNHDIKKVVKQLRRQGYCVVEDFLGDNSCKKIINNIVKIHNKIKANKNIKNNFSKSGQIIIRDLILRDPKNFLDLISKKFIMKALEDVFQNQFVTDNKFIIDNCMASNSVNVKKKYSSLVHVDGHLPVSDFKNTSDVIVLFCLDNFTKNNGATKIWPKSHLSGIRIQNKKKYSNKLIKNFKYLTAKRGSIIFFLGQTWHQIGENIDNKSRWGILCHYKRWWIKPSTDFTKCGSRIYKMLNNKQKELLGFNSIPPKFNFKLQKTNYRTLRKVSSLSKNFSKAIQY